MGICAGSVKTNYTILLLYRILKLWTQSTAISEFVLADYTSQQFKLYLFLQSGTSATLWYNWLITSLFTDPAQILKEHETITTLQQSTAISEFVLADYTSQQFKLCQFLQSGTSATLWYNWIIISLFTDPAQILKEHETIIHESHYHNQLRFLNLCWPTILVNSSSFVYSCRAVLQLHYGTIG